MNRWITTQSGRAPRILSALFVGAVGVFAVVAVDAASRTAWDPVLAGFTTAMAVFIVLASALWPLLRWDRTAGWGRKAGSVAFLVLVGVPVAVGQPAAFMFILVATVHAVFVFGLAGGFVYAAALLVYGFGVHWWFQRDVFGGLLEAAIMGVFVVWAVASAHLLLTAGQRAQDSRRLLRQLTAAHAELRQYADRVAELSVNEERTRMSRELHDSMGHHLTVINLGLLNAERYRELKPEQAWAEVRQARELTQRALDDTRRWVRALRPLALEGRASTEAMAMLAASFDGMGIEVEFIHNGSSDLPEEVGLMFYRALQEGMTNVVRHSGATAVTLEVVADREQAALRIVDNGSGAAERVTESGLRGLRERAEEIGGTVHIHNRLDGGGFALSVVVPLVSGAAAV